MIMTFAILACALLVGQAQGVDGHSKMGTAFDTGMRTRPKALEGIGNAPFPITTSNPEVQKWFNQGNALLHSFWWEESERAFRWCLKLDPDCAMAYWGLAQGGYNWFAPSRVSNDPKDRYQVFLQEAVKRKGKVSDRERMFIEAWEHAFKPGASNPAKTLRDELGKIVAKYPDDVEAKVLLAFYNIDNGGSRSEAQRLIAEVLAVRPDHPGAHHATIHLWDYRDPVMALKSCQAYGTLAPRVGHALHMPGHAFSKMGMWHEAARAMDAATRTELYYMNDRLALPYESWNYSHNRNYLCYLQEQLGMAQASIRGARDLINAPSDPESSNEDNAGFSEGIEALVRACIKFEMWDEILQPGYVPWSKRDESEKRFAETLAYAGKGELDKARASLKALQDAKGRNGENEAIAEAAVLVAEGKPREATKKLVGRAASEDYAGDPPYSPWPLYRFVADAYMAAKDYQLAVDTYKRALGKEKCDAFSYAGLASAYAALGDTENAKKYAGYFKYVWSDADPGLKWSKQVDSLRLDVNAVPPPDLPASERRYRPEELGSYGPANWEPFAAPLLQCRNKDGKTVRLDQFRGKNVLLIFYLSEKCVHCVEQLAKINERVAEFDKRNTVVLAVDSSTPEQIQESLKLGDFNLTLLSDHGHENARRFASYDDFENMELHSTILIDGEGKIRWKRTGGDPFMNIGFLLREIDRIPK